VLPNSARTPSGRPSPDVPSTSPGRSLAEQYGRPLPRGPLEPFQGIISSGAFIYSCPYHTCTHASKRNSANAPAGNLWQDAGAGSCRCETVRSHSGSHVRLSRMQSVSLLSDFMRSSCTAQLLHSAAPAQRSSCSAQLLHSGAYPLSAPACVVAQGLLRGRAHREITAHHGRDPPLPHPTLPAPLSHEGSCTGLARVGEGVAGGPHCLLAHFANFLCTTRPAAPAVSSAIPWSSTEPVCVARCRCVRMPRCCDLCGCLF
jgi:hypothetical protein